MPAKPTSSTEQVVDIDPLPIYFTFSRIRPRFSCGRTIESTIQQFRNGELQPRDLPLLSVLTDGTDYFSQNNRRLYTYKQLKREGLLESVPVRLRPVPQTRRMQSKYTSATCSLTATLMRDVEGGGASATASRPAAATAGGEQSDEEAVASESEHDSNRRKGEPTRQRETGDAEARTAASASPSSSPSNQKAKSSSVNEHKADDSEEREVAGKAEIGLSRKQKKQSQKNKKAQLPKRQGGTTKCRRGSESDDDSGGGGGSSLEAELRKLGLQ
ncbi:hypothetical protein ABL78_4223 [Leptomonas seymouri]|uniref:Uncharacterized protein n=1 Tax=Leptomonas seymouri TaxID=5684 RepID=A0A0N0P637_LEPSE|nr:hypothetical protein ABL78_4223 [Leptomonas seymouri]|eukprot:KPI86707.1 hypothetical protein ABL78_4223 [Leptomonas seymouri]